MVAACAAVLAAGGLETTGDGDTGGPPGAVATIGFLALVGLPALVVASVIARGLVAAWQPQRIAARLDEGAGGSPVLAAWALVIWLALLGLVGMMFQAVWMLANQTAWKPITVSVVMPGVAAATVLVMLAFAWPAVRLVARMLRYFDRHWRVAGARSLLTPWWIAGGLVVATAGALAAMWLLVVAPRIGPFDLTIFITPAVGIAVTAAVHVAWPRVPARPRTYASAAVGVLAVGTIAFALIAAETSPSLALAIWGDRPIAGLAIDKLYDLDELRAGVSLAELAPTVAKPGAAHPDIILITIDTVRADHTPPYGGRADMPGLRQLGEIGAVFDWAFSPSNVTRRSIPSMVIGLQPNRVHGRVVGWALRVDPRHVLLAERLSAGGYDTAGFMCCEGFWGTEFHTGLQRGLAHLEIEPNGIELAKKARAWLDAREAQPHNRPLFVWMHILEPHNWPSVSGEGKTDEEKRRFYDHSLAVSDSALVAVLGAFTHRSPELAPIVIVSADHGEGLGEHGQPYHSTDLYNSQTHVPLVIAGPGIHPGHLGETVSLVDLVPTIMELAGFQAPHGPAIDGRSLAELATGKRAADTDGGEAFAAQIKDRSNPGGLTAVVRGKWKLISNNGVLELYDLRGDPMERINQIHAPVRAKLIDQLRALLDRRESAGDASPFP